MSTAGISEQPFWSACPDVATWAGFLAGDHTSTQIDSLFAHLESCAACSLVLARLSDGQESGEILGASGGDEGILEESAFLRLRQFTHSQDWIHGADPLGQEHKAFGRFRLLRRLGAGSFGFVYLAVDDSLARHVAIKVPRGGATMSSEERRRFVWEGQAAATLRHKNVVSVLEAGQFDGIPYIACEYCGGARLADAMARGAIEPRTSAQLILELARAVEHAHSRGILHRDIKPSNILLDDIEHGGITLEERRVIPKLADFGLAKRLASEADASATDVDLTGCARGTPAYMAPEAFHGDSSTRSDVFALGVVLYEMLCGKRLFHNVSVQERLRQASEGRDIALRQHPTGSAARADVLPENLPRDLETICWTCLRSDPSDRYAGAGQLADDLERWLNGDAIQARQLRAGEKVWRWIKYDPARAALTALLLAAPIMLVIGLVLHNRGLEKAVDRAAASEQRARELLYVANVRQMFQAWEDADFPSFLRYQKQYADEKTNDGHLQGIEWTFLDSLVDLKPGEARWQAHSGGVSCVRFSADGKLLATAGPDGTVKVWNPLSRECLHELHGHQGDVNKVLFFQQGEALASVGDDATLRIWDLKKGMLKRTIDTQNGRVFELGIDEANQAIVTAGDGPHACYWDINDWSLRHRVPGARVKAMSVHSKAPYLGLASSQSDQPILQVLDVSNDACEVVFQVPDTGAVDDLVFSHDGGRLAAASRLGVAQIYNVVDGSLISRLQGHRDAVKTIAFSPNDQLIATGSDDRTIRVWDMHGRQLKVLRGHAGELWTLEFSPDGDSLVSGDSQGMVRTWNVALRRDLADDATVSSLGNVSPAMLQCLSDRRILTSCSEAAFQLLDTDGRVLQRYGTQDNSSAVVCIQLSPDERRVATATKNGEIAIWNLKTNELEQTLQAHEGVAWCCQYVGNQMLATAGADGECRLWKLGGGQLISASSQHQKPILAMDVSSDGKLLATASADGTARVWRLPSLEPVQVLGNHEGGVVHDVAFSPEGNQIATCSHDGYVILHDTASGQILERYQGHRGRAWCVEFSPDGKTLVSGGMRGIVRFWRVGTPGSLGEFDTGLDGIMDVAIDPSGAFLSVASGTPNSRRGTLIRWNLRP